MNHQLRTYQTTMRLIKTRSKSYRKCTGNRNLSTKFYSNQSSQLDRQKLVETRQKHVQKEWHLAPSRQINRVWLFQRVVLVRSVGVHVNLVLNYVQKHCSEIQSSRSFIFFFFDRARARVKGVRSVYWYTVLVWLVTQFPRKK